MKKNLFTKFLETIFVKDIKCISCNRELNINNPYCLCKECYNKLKFNNGLICKICGTKLFGDINICKNCISNKNYFDKALSVFTYEGIIKDLVKQFKFCGAKYMGEYLSKFLLEKYNQSNLLCDLVIPVPMHKNSLKKRGYNQAEQLCNCFVDIIEVDTNLLSKIKQTQEQAKSSFEQRKKNLTDCFIVNNKEKLKGKNVLLVDDIFTTGNTANECSKTLKKYGANSVIVLTLCSTVFNSIEKINIQNDNK